MLHLLAATVVKDSRRIPEKGSDLQCPREMCMAYYSGDYLCV